VFTADGTYTDLRDEWAGDFSAIIGDRWQTDMGEFGLLGSISSSELKSDLHGFQLGMLNTVTAPNGETVAVPAGFQLRTNDVDRERDSYYLAGQYRNNDGIAYVDFANSRIVFTKQPSAVETVEYDYQASMPALELTESPWFPREFHDAIYHLMVSDDFMIQNSDKAKSYARDNQAEAARIIQQMVMWNARLVQQ
jgi:hypothetical protein